VIYLVESIDVQPDDLDALLDGFERHYLPGARERGMEFVACWHTPTNIGEDVTVTLIFGLEGWAEWEKIRNAAVSDPGVAKWVEVRRSLMLRGRRTFSEPAAFSPK
jgi:NIPSNAP